jgi:hypothetical protein
MKQVPEGFELADEPKHWAFRYPGVAMTLVSAAFSVTVIAVGVWIDDRQRPQWEKIDAAIAKLSEDSRQDMAKLSEDSSKAIAKLSQENQWLAWHQLEWGRYIGLALEGIAESANVRMPTRPKELDRAESHVRNIQERSN